MGRYAHEAFDDDSFPMLRYFGDRNAAHMFAMLPVEKAIRWLEAMTSDDPAALLSWAEQRESGGDYRDALAALWRANELDRAGSRKAKIDTLRKQIEEKAAAQAKRFEAGMSADAAGWIDEFLSFRSQFEFTDAAKPLLDRFRKLREEQTKPADELFNASRTAFQSGNQEAGYAHYRDIVAKYPASRWYRPARRWLAERK
jgi:hypothetical protein